MRYALALPYFKRWTQIAPAARMLVSYRPLANLLDDKNRRSKQLAVWHTP